MYHHFIHDKDPRKVFPGPADLPHPHTSDPALKPGMFHLLCIPNQEAIEALHARVLTYLTEFSGYPETALNNVAGVLLCSVGSRAGKEEAIDKFKHILIDDPENLNAWQNCRVTHAELGQAKEAAQCAAKLNELHGSKTSRQKIGCKHREARCLAEQGFALTFAVGAFEELCVIGGTDSYDRNVSAKNLFEKAFQIDNFEVFCPEERRQWQYFLAESYHHIHDHYIRTMRHKDTARLAVFNKAVPILVKIARESNRDIYQAKAWAFLGTFFWKESGVSVKLHKIVHEYNLSNEYKDPEICFKAACKLSPNHPHTMSHYSLFLCEEKRFDEAVELLNRSTKMDESAHNWFAFSIRGNAYRKMYITQQQSYRESSKSKGRGRYSGPLPDKNLLEKAREDLQHSTEIHPNLLDMVKLGDILHLQENKQEAMACFEYVVSHLDGQKNPEVHSKMGYCLSDMANEDNSITRKAVESFKRAVEIEGGHFHKPHSPYHAVRHLARMCKRDSNPVYLIYEICFWLTYIHNKYQHTAHLVEGLCRDFSPQMLEVCKCLVENGQPDLASLYRSKVERTHTQTSQASRLLQDEVRDKAHSTIPESLSVARISPSVLLPPLRTASNKLRKMYDCFILHSHQNRDAEWVYYSLLPRMEDCHGYKCVIPVRDTGSTADEAACVIVILTPTFCKDEAQQKMMAILMSDSSRVVLPVSLEDCIIPKPLKDTKVSKYYSWEILLQSVREACKC